MALTPQLLLLWQLSSSLQCKYDIVDHFYIIYTRTITYQQRVRTRSDFYFVLSRTSEKKKKRETTMSTIQFILETLEKSKKEKMDSIDTRYREHAAWIQSELLKIQALIQPSLTAQQIEEVKLIQEPQESNSKKRKSPETAYQGPKQSPEQKRASINFEELFVSINLPADPNRATKDVLLSALAGLGHTNVPSKTLKKDIIEMIKDKLLAQRRESESMNQQASEPVVEEEEEEAVVEQEIEAVEADLESVNLNDAPEEVQPAEESIPEPPQEPTPAVYHSPTKTPGRKGSLMLSTFRDMINNQVPLAPEPQEESKTVNVESEFKNRYRASQIRKSQILEAPETNTIVSDIPASQESEAVTETESVEPEAAEVEVQQDLVEEEQIEEGEIAEEHCESVAADEQQQEEEEEEDVEPAEEEEDEECDKEEKAEEGIWMEVASPIKAPEPTHVEALESTGSSFASTSESISAKSDSSKSSLSSQASLVAKKPTNLASGQSSFLDKGPSKPLVPALEKAKQLKAAEELKAAQKKKEQEQKQLQKVNSSKNPLTSPWNKFKTKSTKTVDEQKEQPDKKKGGIFGGLFGKKDKTVESTKPPVFDISVVETKKNSEEPVVSSSSSEKIQQSVASQSAIAAPVVKQEIENEVKVHKVEPVAAKPTVSRNEPVVAKLADKATIKSILDNYNNALGTTPSKAAVSEQVAASTPASKPAPFTTSQQEHVKPAEVPKQQPVVDAPKPMITPSKPAQEVLREIPVDALAAKALYTPIHSAPPQQQPEEEEEPSDEYQIEDR